MKTCLTTQHPKIATSALVVALSAATGHAIAQEVSFFPNYSLTPYQIVSDDGRCIEAVSPESGSGWQAALRPCADGVFTQKFYLLRVKTNPVTVAEFVPQTDSGSGEHVIIALASELDRSPGAGYSIMYFSQTGGIRGSETINAPAFSVIHAWSINRATTLPHWVAFLPWSHEDFRVVQPIPIRYVAVNGAFSEAFTDRAYCSSLSFGEPAPGIPKVCMGKGTAWPKDTPLNVTLNLSIDNQTRCLSRSGDSLAMGVNCQETYLPGDANWSQTLTPPSTSWTLRPTTYPH